MTQSASATAVDEVPDKQTGLERRCHHLHDARAMGSSPTGSARRLLEIDHKTIEPGSAPRAFAISSMNAALHLFQLRTSKLAPRMAALAQATTSERAVP